MGISKSGNSYRFAVAKGGKHYFSIPAKSVYEFIGFINDKPIEQCKITFDKWAIKNHPSAMDTRAMITILKKHGGEFIEVKGFDKEDELEW